jgi:tRNA dimethylallyltransferase
MSGDPPRFVAITGTTATGKTDLSIALSHRLPVEIISMDSRQVYQGMDIGTDKVGIDEQAGVPHHGLDLVPPDQRYSAGQFARDVRGWIAEIEARGRIPLLVGGTGFFLRAVMEPMFSEPKLDADRLKRLRNWLAEQPREVLERFVSAVDPVRAPLAIEGGPQRMARAIEVALLSGTPLSRWHQLAPADGGGLPGVVLLLGMPVDVTNQSINNRVVRMVDRGLVKEVQALLAAGFIDSDPGMTGTGYREMTAYLRGETTLQDAMEDIRGSTRRYARRQRTWYRHQLPDHTVNVDATTPLEDQVEIALNAMAVGGFILPDSTQPEMESSDKEPEFT